MKRIAPILITILAAMLIVAPAADATKKHSLRWRVHHLEQQLKQAESDMADMQAQLDDTTDAARLSLQLASTNAKQLNRCFYGMPTQTTPFTLPGTSDTMMVYRIQVDQPGVWLAAINGGCLNQGGASGAARLR